MTRGEVGLMLVSFGLTALRRGGREWRSVEVDVEVDGEEKVSDWRDIAVLCVSAYGKGK